MKWRDGLTYSMQRGCCPCCPGEQVWTPFYTTLPTAKVHFWGISAYKWRLQQKAEKPQGMPCPERPPFLLLKKIHCDTTDVILQTPRICFNFLIVHYLYLVLSLLSLNQLLGTHPRVTAAQLRTVTLTINNIKQIPAQRSKDPHHWSPERPWDIYLLRTCYLPETS